jgi:hypothetical protein
MLANYRKHTEASCPYTILQVEDAMFIDQGKAISLEYIFYQKDGEYVSLEEKKIDENYESDPLRTIKYKAKENKESIYKHRPINYIEKKDEKGNQVDYLEDLTAIEKKDEEGNQVDYLKDLTADEES